MHSPEENSHHGTTASVDLMAFCPQMLPLCSRSSKQREIWLLMVQPPACSVHANGPVTNGRMDLRTGRDGGIWGPWAGAGVHSQHRSPEETGHELRQGASDLAGVGPMPTLTSSLPVIVQFFILSLQLVIHMRVQRGGQQEADVTVTPLREAARRRGSQSAAVAARSVFGVQSPVKPGWGTSCQVNPGWLAGSRALWEVPRPQV